MIEENKRYARNPRATLIQKKNSYVVVLEGKVIRLADVDVHELSAVFQRLVLPTPGVELKESLSEASTEALEILIEHDVIWVGEKAEVSRLFETATSFEKPCRRLVVGMTGAVAALAAATILRDLQYRFAKQVDVVITESAAKFVRPDALEYFGMRAWTNTFQAREDLRVPHIELARAADLVLVFPASANAIHRFATGACSDLLSLIVVATRAPVVVVPSMNHAMWTHPAVQRNAAVLREDGICVVEPGLGIEVADRTKPDAMPELGGAGVGGAGSLMAVLYALLSEQE